MLNFFNINSLKYKNFYFLFLPIFKPMFFNLRKELKNLNYYNFLIKHNNFFLKKYNNFFWISKYLSFFLKNITSIRISWQLINLKLVNNKVLLIKLWKITYTKKLLKFFFCSAWFFFYLLLQLFFFKNIDSLSLFFKKIIQRQPIKFHKIFFQRINIIFKKYLLILYKKKKLYGYRIYFKGKLGRKGSVKKSLLYFSGGKISYTNKSLKYNYKYFLIPTETGIIGCYISIFY